jgi:hypothetical protein
MGVVHPRQQGELVPLDPADQTSAVRAFSRPPGSGPAQVLGRKPVHQMQTSQSQPEQRDFARRLCVALWHGGGWWQETIEMFEAFYSYDGLQDRSAYILATAMHPIPEPVLAAARRAFVDVRVIETNYFNGADGIITPFALYEFAGLIGQKYGHKSRILFTMPVKIVGPNSLVRLEHEAHAANPARGKDNKQQGKCILGAVRGEGQNKGPFSTFVALPTWTREPEFPLTKGLSKQPITSIDQTPMRFMRFEMMKHMQVSPLINPDPETMPSDPRWVLIEGRQLGERFPAVEAEIERHEPPLALPDVVPFLPDPNLPPPPGMMRADALPGLPPVGVLVVGGESQLHGEISMPELPGDLELESRIATDGLDWLKDYRCPTKLAQLKLIHNTEVMRKKREAVADDLGEPEPPKPAPSAKAKKPAKPKKTPLSVPAA